MIRVNRGPEPDGFAMRAADWYRRFEEARRKDPKLTASQFWSRVRATVRADAQVLYEAFHGKCAFCEAKMAHVSSPHVEHYCPKSRFPDRMFDWQNWLLSCGRCNDKKWAHFPDCDDQPCLLDPTTEDPATHLDFSGAWVLAKTRRGEETIKLVGLDRSPLEDERAQWLMKINELLLLVCCVPEASAEARELLIWAMQADAPYSAMTRCYLRQKTPRLADPEISHAHVVLHDPQERIAGLVEQYANQLRGLD
jgi:uncharacterized protein (TIGR02646 family)